MNWAVMPSPGGETFDRNKYIRQAPWVEKNGLGTLALCSFLRCTIHFHKYTSTSANLSSVLNLTPLLLLSP